MSEGMLIFGLLSCSRAPAPDLAPSGQPSAETTRPSPTAPADPGSDPATTIRRMYAAPEGPGEQWLPYATRDLSEQWAAAQRAAERLCPLAEIHAPGGREVGWTTDDQESDFTSVDVQVTEPGAAEAVAVARFTNLGRAVEIRYSMHPDADGWRIDDVALPGGDTLRGAIAETMRSTDFCP